MGLKSTWNTIKAALGGITSFGSKALHFAGAKEYFDMFTGGFFPSSETIKEKGWKGMFGLGDELPFERRLMSMTPKRSKAIRDYIIYHFSPPKGCTAVQAMVFWYFRNKFRAWVLGLPTSAAQTKAFKTKVTNTHADGTTTATETETAVEEPGFDKPQEWLERLADQILEGGEKKRTSNYKSIRKGHLATDVPYPPTDNDGIMAAGNEILSELVTPVAKIRDTAIRDAELIDEEIKKMAWLSPKTWLYRFIN